MNWVIDSVSKYWKDGLIAICKTAFAILALCVLWQFLNSPFAPPLLMVSVISCFIAYLVT